MMETRPPEAGSYEVQPASARLWLRLLWMFLRINLLTSSGPASVGLL